MLKELNKIEQRINSKINLSSIEMTNNKNDYENQIKLLSAKIDTISEKNIQYESFKEKMDDLIKYKIKNEENLLINKIKLDDISKEIKNYFNKYDKIIKKHLIIDGLVGENCRFKTNPEMIRYILDNISILNNFKDQNIINLKGYKTKLESLIFSFKTQIDNIMKSMAEFTTNSIKESENRINGIFELYNDRLVEIRMQNSNVIKNIVERNEILGKEWKSMEEMKKIIYSKIDTDILNINNSMDNNYNEFKDELNKLNIKCLNLKSEIENLRNKRERQLNYSKKINLKYPQNAFDEDYLYKDTKLNKRFSISLENKTQDKWKKFTQKSFNKVIQNNELNTTNDSNIYTIEINKDKIRKTLSYGGLRFKNNNYNNREENKLLNIHKYFESINEEENEINNNDLKYLNKAKKDNNENENLSNKTISDENENNKICEDEKNIIKKQINTIEYLTKNDSNDSKNNNLEHITKNDSNDSKINNIENIIKIDSIDNNNNIENITKNDSNDNTNNNLEYIIKNDSNDNKNNNIENLTKNDNNDNKNNTIENLTKNDSYDNKNNNIDYIYKNNNNDNNDNKIKNTIFIKKNYENIKNNVDRKINNISNIKFIKSISSFENKSFQNINKKDHSLNNKINIFDNISFQDKNTNNITIKNIIPITKEKDIIKNIIISKEINNSENENDLKIGLPKIEDKRYITTFHEPEENIIKRLYKNFQIFKKNKNFSNSIYSCEINNLKKIKNYSNNAGYIDDTYRQKSKSINNIYYSKFAEKLKEKKILNIKKNKDSISTHEIMFDPFKNINAKLYTKNCPKENLIDNSLTNSNNISFNKTNHVNNKHAYSANKKKEDNVNSTSEYNHIIYIPPPSDSINKSLLGIS